MMIYNKLIEENNVVKKVKFEMWWMFNILNIFGIYF